MYGKLGARADKQVSQTQQRSKEWILLLGFKNQIISAIAGERIPEIVYLLECEEDLSKYKSKVRNQKGKDQLLLL